MVSKKTEQVVITICREFFGFSMMSHDCKGKVKYAAFEPKWLIRPALISGFCSIKQLGSPSQQLPVHHKVISALNWPVPIYTPRWREALKVKCLTQEQNIMSLV